MNPASLSSGSTTLTSEVHASATDPEHSAVPESVRCANWIWTDDDPDATNVWMYARRSFVVKRLNQARLYVAADLRYLLWINGRQVGFGPPKSDWRYPTLDTYNIASYLQPGENTITMPVYSLGNVEDISSCMPRRGGMLSAIEIDDEYIVTDQSWKTAREYAYLKCARRRGDVQPHNEVFDSGKSLGQPWSVGYDDTRWGPATVLSDGPLLEPAVAIEPRDIPLIPWQTIHPVRLQQTGRVKYNAATVADDISTIEYDIRDARRTAEIDNGTRHTSQSTSLFLDASGLADDEGLYARWDFGMLWTGYPAIEVEGTPGTVVDISYAEHLSDGTVDPAKSVRPYCDRVILGSERLRHRIFWPKCLQYMQVDVRGGAVRIYDALMEVSTYPVQYKGSFCSTDGVLDQAWRASAHTLRLCMEDSYMDTPWRERGSWLGDSIVQSRANYYSFGDTALIRRFLRLHARGQLPDGSMCSKYPAKRTTSVHTWSVTYPITLLDYLTYSGDVSLIREVWPNCLRLLQWLNDHRTDSGLYGNFRIHVTPHENVYVFIDWSPVDTRGSNTAMNAFVYECLRSCIQLARSIEDDAAVEHLSLQAEELAERFREAFWDSNRGVFVNGVVDGRQTTRWGCQENYLALAFGLADEYQRKRIIANLADQNLLHYFVMDDDAHEEFQPGVAIARNTYRWNDRKMVPIGTPYFAYWATTALFEAGMARQALDIIREHWGRFAKEGSSTVWEMWDHQGSLSHAWSAGPAVVLGQYILGVRRTTANPRSIHILPVRADLTFVQGRVPTKFGQIDVSWRYHDRIWQIWVNVPDGVHASVGLPQPDIDRLYHNDMLVDAPDRMTCGSTTYLATSVTPGEHYLHGR